MFKVINNIAATIIGDLFTHSIVTIFAQNVVPNVRTVYNGQNYMKYDGPLIWNMILGYIKNPKTLDIFKGKIRKWKPINSPVVSAKNIPNLDFLNQI